MPFIRGGSSFQPHHTVSHPSSIRPWPCRLQQVTLLQNVAAVENFADVVLGPDILAPILGRHYIRRRSLSVREGAAPDRSVRRNRNTAPARVDNCREESEQQVAEAKCPLDVFHVSAGTIAVQSSVLHAHQKPYATSCAQERRRQQVNPIADLRHSFRQKQLGKKTG